jgi:hypothetical protein
MYQRFNDAQAKPRSTKNPGSAFSGLHKAVEHVIDFVFCNANSGVSYFDTDRLFAIYDFADRIYRQPDASFFGKLNGIPGYIQQNLSEPQLVGFDEFGYSFRQNRLVGDAFFNSFLIDNRRDRLNYFFDRNGGFFKMNLPGLYLREVKDIIDQFKQVFPAY